MGGGRGGGRGGLLWGRLLRSCVLGRPLPFRIFPPTKSERWLLRQVSAWQQLGEELAATGSPLLASSSPTMLSLPSLSSGASPVSSASVCPSSILLSLIALLSDEAQDQSEDEDVGTGAGRAESARCDVGMCSGAGRVQSVSEDVGLDLGAGRAESAGEDVGAGVVATGRLYPALRRVAIVTSREPLHELL